ncbi:tetratricopeptide repeat protein [Aurantibacter sp.]|uniref:tetratricopeptide repeat protein n=1 Tax=Aurantibacter sp. TaxID=2807103 RepID=UPI0035C83076
MKIFSAILFSILFLSCKNDQKQVLNRFNPSENIKQIIKNKEAKELFDYGWDYSLNGEYELAKTSFHKSLEIENSPLTLNELGLIEFTTKNYTKAIECFSKAKSLDNTYWPIYINEARTYWKTSDFENAENTLIKLKQICDSEYWIAYADFYLSVTYANSHQKCEKVYKYLEKSKTIINDPKLKVDYNKFKEFINKNCR